MATVELEWQARNHRTIGPKHEALVRERCGEGSRSTAGRRGVWDEAACVQFVLSPSGLRRAGDWKHFNPMSGALAGLPEGLLRSVL